ncbi:MAG: energy-coupling factor ABC transporter permease [Lachnospiraceae bacterium]|nr:energy-coupling factor ABC transporter permease [Lachnospiraceae bacterium]
MHMADALVSPAVGITMYAMSGMASVYSIKKLRQEPDFKKKIPTMGVMGAMVFATQMINFTIPGTGSSGHLCGGILLTGLLGPYAGFLSMIGVLLIQCLFFADGGLLALGGNIFNMAFYGCFFGALIWKIVMQNGISKRKITLYSILGSVITLQLGAFSVTIQTLCSGVTELPFKMFLSLMLPIHLAIGFVEGLITMAILNFIYAARPELLWSDGHEENKYIRSGLSYKKTMIIFTCVFFVIAGFVSLIASKQPDGLEWSIKKITGNTEINAKTDSKNDLDYDLKNDVNDDLNSSLITGTKTDIYENSEKIQQKTSLLPDYNFKNSDSDLGTSVSGIVGCIIVIIFLTITGFLIKLSKKGKHKLNE